MVSEHSKPYADWTIVIWSSQLEVEMKSVIDNQIPHSKLARLVCLSSRRGASDFLTKNVNSEEFN